VAEKVPPVGVNKEEEQDDNENNYPEINPLHQFEIFCKILDFMIHY
jgi:hypothetical protein